MPSPTRAQIEAAHAFPKYKVELNTSGTTWVTWSNGSIIDVNGALESSNSLDNGFAFGAYIVPHVTITTTHDNVAYAWKRHKIRVSYSFSTADYVVAFTGIIKGRTRNENELIFDCVGFDYLIRITKLYSGVNYRIPVATKTTISSIENPATVGYRAGLINRIWWAAGGRPLEQSGSYPTASFYYSVPYQSIANPDWTWISGDNAFDELLKLAKASGGQIYQNVDGVMYYRQPLSLTASDGLIVSPFEFSAALFDSISEDLITDTEVASITCNFIQRYLQQQQEVYNDSTPRLILAGESKIFTLDMKEPVYTYELEGKAPAAWSATLKAIFYNNMPATPTVTNFDVAATRVILTVTNTYDQAFAITNIIINGRPVTAGEQRIYTYGSGIPNLQIEDNVYIQNEFHAEKIARMVYDFYANTKSRITLHGGYDPDRYIGELVTIDYPAWSADLDDLYRIVSINVDNTGMFSEFVLIGTDGIPNTDDYFIVGTTYSGATTKKAGY